MPWTLERAETSAAVEGVRALWRAYWKSLGFGAEFQGFGVEVDSLPGKYAGPGGCLLVAWVDGAAAGTGAYRALGEDACEAKRLYVDPVYRGRGIAKGLLRRLIEEAKAAGYRDMFADTLPVMAPALRMYRELGFEETGAYSPDPTPGAIYLRLKLEVPGLAATCQK